MIAKEIGNYLAAKGIGTMAKDIFIGQFPIVNDDGDTTQSGVYLVATPGDGEDEYQNLRYENLDIWSVNPLYETAYNKLKDIHAILSRGQNYQTTNYLVYFSHDTTGIMDMDRTRDGLKLFKMTIRLIYRDINLIS